MPTTDIIGYLWGNRQELELTTLSDALHLAADLEHVGLTCVSIEEVKVFGTTLETRGEFIRRTPEEWDRLVHAAILSSAVEHTTGMLHTQDGDAE